MPKGTVLSTQQVLIVDDDQTYRSILSDIFAEYQVTTANGGSEAIETIQHLSPDVIILDIMMPGMDGYEVCKAIRTNKSTASTPTVFYSSMDSLHGRLKAYDLGGNDFINKNSPSDEIRAKIKRMLSSEQEHIAIRQELAMGNQLLENMQKETSALHLLSQFSQACQFCFDYETLATVLFNCLFKLNLRGVIYFKNEDIVISSNGSHTKLEEEILHESRSFARIHSFGENRVLLNWENCALLVKDAGDNLDFLAHFMGAVQTGTRSLEIHSSMLEKVLSLETKYRDLKSPLSDQATESKNLKEQLFDSGLISRFDFDIQDEQDLDKILEPYGNDLVSAFGDADDSIREVRNLLKRIHVPQEELKWLFSKKRQIYITSDDCDAVLF